MWIRKGRRYVFMDQAGDGTGGGAGSAAAGDGSAAGGAGGAQGAGGASDGGQAAGSGDGSAGASSASASVANALAAAAAQGNSASIPEKYQVKKEDGSIDIEASSLKLAEAYGHLEKRLGSGDAPPKSADDYQIAVPDALKDVWNPKEDQLLGEFLKNAHAAGMTQKQIDLAMGAYLDVVPKLMSGSKQVSADECIADLRSEWKSDEQYQAELGKAFKAATAFAGDDAQYIIDTYGNDPKLIRMLNRMGNEMSEDHSPNPPGGLPTAESVDSLIASEAYSNPKHPDHAKVSRQVAEYYRRQAAAAEKAGNVPLI